MTRLENFINSYINIIDFIASILVKILILIMCIILGSILGFLVIWIEGLNNAIGPNNKGFKQIIKIIFYPPIYSIGGIFRGPILMWKDFKSLF